MSALMQDVVRPELRAVAVAVSLVVAHVLGDASPHRWLVVCPI